MSTKFTIHAHSRFFDVKSKEIIPLFVKRFHQFTQKNMKHHSTLLYFIISHNLIIRFVYQEIFHAQVAFCYQNIKIMPSGRFAQIITKNLQFTEAK